MIRVGVILAAGRSERFGRDNKLLADLRGKPLAKHAATAMLGASLDHRIAVVSDDKVGRLFDGFHVVTIEGNASMQSESLLRGLEQARLLHADRLLVMLADMPHISCATVDAVLGKCSNETASAVSDGCRKMPPACFPRYLFPDLERASGDSGARSLLQEVPPSGLVSVEAKDLLDVDRVEDLAALKHG